ncbi:Asp-tRNA(Asn)/Glu-tRNA(Gln) amidotransferase subunit GatC [Deinococcus cavernae]|uniref:Aspartyl/glutamyl-tRNA(Asn/Gln) amidotransferase subunit C n=1 Tax=Deinococcus cavernae TaxID=2320857 RepID=A0A418VAG9_9DEIO|nr:Asp-tRNA(Asn)/Glu-tRNA(Gln) amidotransferase subunit GatC [Deinococcus cavernae]RJF73114.1 Asp-tRNA(Asn)/Glu-tRNA(Gln) amidotransferase subunit GatC [Deinococcus cavernae]
MIDAAQIEHLASLARLQLTPDEQTAMHEDLTRVLGYFEQLNEVNTDGVEEMQRPVNLVNVLRDDVPGQAFDPAVVAALAPEMQGGQIRIPRTVEQGG